MILIASWPIKLSWPSSKIRVPFRVRLALSCYARARRGPIPRISSTRCLTPADNAPAFQHRLTPSTRVSDSTGRRAGNAVSNPGRSFSDCLRPYQRKTALWGIADALLVNRLVCCGRREHEKHLLPQQTSPMFLNHRPHQAGVCEVAALQRRSFNVCGAKKGDTSALWLALQRKEKRPVVW